MTTNQEVHTWHINIGTGDSAIHLYVLAGTGTPSPKPIIQYAVLIDGGVGSGTEEIKRTIRFIRANYDFAALNYDADEDTMRFDSVVITHWDHDHYEGIIQLLVDDWDKQMEALQPAMIAHMIAQPVADRETAYRNYISLPSRYFRYGPNYPAAQAYTAAQATPNIDNAELLTTFYVPYVNSTADENRLCTIDVRAQFGTMLAANQTLQNLGGADSSLQCNLFTPYDENGNDNFLSSYFPWEFAGANPRTTKKTKQNPGTGDENVNRCFIAPKQCRLFASHTTYLGAELFTNTMLGTTDWKTIKNPATIIQTLPAARSFGLFIVAGDLNVLGDLSLGVYRDGATDTPVFSSNINSLLPHMSVKSVSRPDAMTNGVVQQGTVKPVPMSTKPSSLPPRPQHIIDNFGGRLTPGDSHDKNQRSVSCVLLSRGTGTNDKSFNVHHYNAGDALFDVENAITDWLTGYDPSNSSSTRWNIKTVALKLSHHGSMYSAPTHLLKQLSAKIIFAPCNKSMSAWAHPRPEILLAIDALTLKAQLADPQSLPPLLLQNYPKWMRLQTYLNATATQVYSLGPFWKTGPKANQSATKRFIADLTELYKGVTTSLWTEWDAKGLRNKPTGAAKITHAEIATTLLRQRWDKFSKTEETEDDDPTAVMLRFGLTSTSAYSLACTGDAATISAANLNMDIAGPNSATPVNPNPTTPTVPQTPPQAPTGVQPTGGSANPPPTYPQSSSTIVPTSTIPVSTTVTDPDSDISDCDCEALPQTSKYKGHAKKNRYDLRSQKKQKTKGTNQQLLPQRHTAVDVKSENLAEQGRDPNPASGNVSHNGAAVPMAGIAVDRFKQRALAVTSNPMYFLCGSNVVIPSTASGEEIGKISPNPSHFDDFLNLLRSGYVVLQGKPTKISGDPANPNTTSECFIMNTDEWMQSLRACNLGIQNVSVSGNMDSNNKNFFAKKLICRLNLGNDATKALTFSTSSTKFSTGESSLREVATSSEASAASDVSYAVARDYKFLFLGLDSLSSVITMNTTTLLSYFTLPWLTVTGQLPGFGDGLTFIIDSESSGSRCGVFFGPTLDYPTSLRLRFKIQESTTGTVKTALDFLQSTGLEIDLNKSYLHCIQERRTTKFDSALIPSTETKIMLEAAVKVESINFTAWLCFAKGRTKLVIDFDNDTGDGTSVFTWLQNAFSSKAPTSSDPQKPSDVLSAPQKDVQVRLHTISISLDTPAAGHKFKVGDITMTLELKIFRAVFFARLSWPDFSLKARLWLEMPPKVDYDLLLVPGYETYDLDQPTLLENPTTNNLTPSNLTSLVTGEENPSMEASGVKLDTVSGTADFAVSKSKGKPVSIRFSGTIMSAPPDDTDAHPPALQLGMLTVNAYYQGASSGRPKSYGLALAARIFLAPEKKDPPAADAPDPAEIDVAVTYTNSSWSVTATVYDLQFAHLYQLFDANAQGPVMDIMEKLSIPYLNISYQRDKVALDNTLLVEGILQVSTIQLALRYEYHSNPKHWKFMAALDAMNPSAPGQSLTIVNLIRGFDPNSSVADAMDEVPFIRDIAIPTVDGDLYDDSPVLLTLEKTDQGIVMWFRVEIQSPAGDISLLFVQWQPTLTGTTTGPRPAPKRILRIQLDHLPKLPDIPIVGAIGQPIDSIAYMFVQDTNPLTNTKKFVGFTAAELANLNASIPDDAKIHFKDIQDSVNAPPPDPTAIPDVALRTGHHIMVVGDGRVVLDHVFGANSKASNPGAPPQTIVHSVSGPRRTVAGGVAQEVSKEDSGSTMGAHQKGFGPFTVNNIGIQIKDSYLYLLVDATVALGPIKLTLIGLGIGMPLEKDVGGKKTPVTFNTLSSLSISDFKVKLSGVDVYFNSPPVMIAGYFEHVELPNSEAYRGGLSVSILPYTLLALGEYRHTFQPDFKSVFVFARLDGPLFTLEFATISGVKASFGYNYDLTIPDASQLTDFPLVQGAQEANSDLKQISDSFGHWNTAKESSMWFAAGLKVDAFQILTADAAAIIAFGANSFKIAIVAMASASFPPTKSSERPPFSFLYIELAIVACLDIEHGSFMLSAQLTPNSYVYGPFCHIFGGAALCYWFGPSPFAGDWVLTIGGYHPAFKPPSYYPVCPRLGMEWRLLDILSARGEIYFAVTPKAAMAGGKFIFTFSAGPIYACFTAWANFLVNFKPFFLTAEIGVSIEVGFQIDIGLIHINIHVDIDADLYLQGPPFAGTAYVNLRIHRFSIDFGDLHNKPDPLPYNDFMELVKKPGPGADNSSDLVVVVIEKGSFDKKTKDPNRQSGDKWWVRGGTFVFRVESKFPVTTVDCGDGTEYISTDSAGGPFYARPMQTKQEVKSTLVVTIVEDDDQHDNGQASTLKLVSKDDFKKENSPWLLTPVVKNVPTALWQKYDENSDPMGNGTVATVLDSSDSKDSTIPHVMGYTFVTPDPVTSLGDPPEFNAVEAMREGVFQDGAPPQTSFVSDKNRLLPASSEDERPRLPVSAPVQNAGLAQEHKVPNTTDTVKLATAPWDEVEQAWHDADVLTVTKLPDGTDAPDDGKSGGLAPVFVDAWSGLFGWQTIGQAQQTAAIAAAAPSQPPPANPADPPVGQVVLQPPLVADKPWNVINDFGTYYLDPPWLCSDPRATIPVPPAAH